MELTISCADIGSVRKGRFGWALRDYTGEFQECNQGCDIAALVRSIGQRLEKGVPVALGFECPLFVPLPEEPIELTRARNNEGNRAWCAGAGAGALATGLTEVPWILKKLREGLDGAELPAVSVNWPDFATSGGLFLWEALVTGRAKASTHCEDAQVAVDAFADALPNPQTSVREEHVYSLLGAALLRAGWNVPISILEAPVLVIAAEPGHSGRTRSARR
jgi:hypothetical protein